MENEILSPLRKEGISSDWLENTDLEEIIIKYLQFNKRNLKENARFWFRSTIQEIHRKARETETDKKGKVIEKTQSQIEAKERALYLEYFKVKEKNNEV